MSSPSFCSRCGTPSDSPDAECPRCLLAAALDERATPRLGPRFLDDLPLPPDQLVIADKYTVIETIARGGMGVVYKVRQENLQRVVAVKMLLGGVHAGEDFKRRFLQEAKAAAQLKHPNIVSIHDWGDDAGQPFFSMDFIEGRNLAQIAREQPMSPRAAAEILRAIAEAVHFAHTRGVLHRDLKPSNVLVDVAGIPHLTDFGLACDLSEGTNLTASGDVLGTPGYLPPEQASARREAIGTHSDVYGLGAILYYLLTSRPPHVAGSVAEALRAVEEREPIAPRQLNPSIPVELESICLKCIEKEPHRRYATAHALVEDISRWLNGEPVHAKPVTLWARANKWRKRRPAVAALLGTVLLLLATATSIVAVLLSKVVVSDRHSQARLTQLQSMVPLLRTDALALIQRREFEEALNRVSSIRSLQPDEPEYMLMAANLQQTLFRFPEAAKLYEDVLKQVPSNAAVKESLELCRNAITTFAATNSAQIPKALLLELHKLLTRQERYPEALAIYEKLGDERHPMFRQWKAQLEEAGIVGPTAGRLTVDADGYLDLFANDFPIRDVSPLKGMPFRRLHIFNTKITDVTPLRGMPLQFLDMGNVRVRDLSPLAGLPLTNLGLFAVQGFSDISPLAGCPLLNLNLAYTEVADLTPLAGAPLQGLLLSGTPVEDLSPIQKMPLRVLDLMGARRVRDISSLAGVPLEWLRLDGNITDLAALHEMPVRQLMILNCPVTNLSVLTSTPVSILRLEATKQIRDLEEIRTIPLKKLELLGCEIKDLAPLSRMPLEFLFVVDTPVQDLAPLKQLPLKEIFLDGSNAKGLDVSPLAECRQLESIVLPRHAKNIHTLRNLPRLRFMAYFDTRHTQARPAADFWRRYDSTPSGNPQR